MADPILVNWSGASGKTYTFSVWPLPSQINDGQDGNYIFCGSEDGRWVPLYIGQGDLGNRTKNPDHSRCLSNKGATHVHVHLNPDADDRLAEEDDLLAAYPQAYQPTGCNERKGG